MQQQSGAAHPTGPATRRRDLHPKTQAHPKENIQTPGDAVRPGIDVRGPISMWVQADIIEQHQLARTDGLRFAEMPRQIQRVDEAGNPMVDEAGEPVMGPNIARDSWVNATALMTVLNLGLMAYMLSLFAIVMGATMAGLGAVVLTIGRSGMLEAS